jgi:hypothetical protein
LKDLQFPASTTGQLAVLLTQMLRRRHGKNFKRIQAVQLHQKTQVLDAGLQAKEPAQQEDKFSLLARQRQQVANCLTQSQ